MLYPSALAVVDVTPFVLLGVGAVVGAGGLWWVGRRLGRLWGRGPRSGGARSGFREDRVVTQTIAERVQAVGKLVALEVYAKEIATASTGWAWLPPLLLSQARLAMIFNFEKQYFVDLTRVRAEDIEELEPQATVVGGPCHSGRNRFRITLPPIEGSLRLIDVTPYDIQNARVLGLLDVIPMTADRQRDLMKRAQTQAAELYHGNDERYLRQARLSAEKHLRALMEMFGVEVEVGWRETAAEKVVSRSVVPEALVLTGAAGSRRAAFGAERQGTETIQVIGAVGAPA